MELDQGGTEPPPAAVAPRPSQQTSQAAATAAATTKHSGSFHGKQASKQQPFPRPPPAFPLPPALPHRPKTNGVKGGLRILPAGHRSTASLRSAATGPTGPDWCSLRPLAPPNVPTSITSLRIKLERIGHSLWVWYQIPGLISAQAERTPGAIGSSWRKLREVTWFFWGVEDKSVHVGVYASRPANLSMESTMWAARNGGRYVSGLDGGGGHGGPANGLVVEFEDLEIF
ncbi:hypothetical protein CISG_06875 [Coccidioides immitis RMSCC 3703]|uniref:Uncharacterized protein n=1 Tax=Coccidioides immitis RMSCC 3703 TaxID=454286 RepID=A0A0J8R0W3_COCIT|nr:hypothetical protein CISG_06875 [Coccidioides immitis RMSCC 3703]